VLHMDIMDDLEITGSKRKYYIAIFVMAQSQNLFINSIVERFKIGFPRQNMF
jgi:hypothetical protein